MATEQRRKPQTDQRAAGDARIEQTDSPHTITDDRIRARAYELYEQRGRGDGRDLDDWVQAERELQDSRIGH